MSNNDQTLQVEKTVGELEPGDIIVGGWYELSVTEPHKVLTRQCVGAYDIRVLLEEMASRRRIIVTQDEDNYVTVSIH